MWFQPHRVEKVFTLFIEALDKLRAEAKCTTVYGRRINIFLYSPRTHFSSVKHVLIINLFNTHTQHLLGTTPILPFKLTSTAATVWVYCTGLEYDKMFFFLLLCSTQTEYDYVCWHTVYRHTQTCTNLYIHTLLQTSLCWRGEAPDCGPTFPMYFSSVRRPNGDCVN